MTDVFTVVFTSTVEGRAESIAWQLSFADLELAKNHVLEEAAKHAADLEAEATGQWEDYEDYSTFAQQYGEIFDAWLIVRTELVEAAPLSTEYAST